MPVIQLGKMPQVVNVRHTEEDWTGLTNATERRKLQNRLNQRARRERKAIQDLQTGVPRRPRGRPKKTHSAVSSSSSNNGDNDSTSPRQHSSASNFDANETSVISSVAAASPQFHRRAVRPGDTFYICEVDTPQTLRLVDRLAAEVHQGTQSGCHPASDMLLSLTQYNVLRAMFTNIAALGLTMNDMKGDVESRFNRVTPYLDGNSSTDLAMQQLPPALRPTMLQMSITHHPWIDPFPLPSFRDALLLANGLYNEVELCNDLVGQCGDRSTGQVGIIVWGEPWDLYGWEMTKSFARKWLWLFRGCKELMESTNYWRARRGEGRLFGI